MEKQRECIAGKAAATPQRPALVGELVELVSKVRTDPFTLLGTSTRVVATETADVNVTFAAGAVGAGGTYHWFFTPTDGQELDTLVTSPAYTINRAGCSSRGTYRVTIRDSCGGAANPDPKPTLLIDGCLP
jgi:hypothetical protein